jgi:hypothetical protein
MILIILTKREYHCSQVACRSAVLLPKSGVPFDGQIDASLRDLSQMLFPSATGRTSGEPTFPTARWTTALYYLKQLSA